MKPGQIVDRFFVIGKNNEKIEIVLRIPRTADAKKALRFINKARLRAEFLGMRRRETLKSEKKFLRDLLKRMRKKTEFFLFACTGNEIVGSANVHASKLEVSRHVGNFGIALREEFTGIGIGTGLAKKVIESAKKQCGFSIIESSYAIKNTRSAKLHKKLGFKRCGVFPMDYRLRNGSYCDRVDVFKFVKKI